MEESQKDRDERGIKVDNTRVRVVLSLLALTPGDTSGRRRCCVHYRASRRRQSTATWSSTRSLIGHHFAMLSRVCRSCARPSDWTRSYWSLTSPTLSATESSRRQVHSDTFFVHCSWLRDQYIMSSFLSCIVLFCCTVHYCLFSFLIFSLLARSSIKWIWIWIYSLSFLTFDTPVDFKIVCEIKSTLKKFKLD